MPHCLRRLSPHGIGGGGGGGSVNARRVGGNLWAATSRISGKEEHVGRGRKKILDHFITVDPSDKHSNNVVFRILGVQSG